MSRVKLELVNPGVHKSTSNRRKLLSSVLYNFTQSNVSPSFYSENGAKAVTLLFDVMQMCCINWHKPDRLAWEGLIFHFPCMLCFVSVISIFSIAVLPSGIRETWWRLILGDTALFITGRLPDNNECRYKIVSFTRCVFYPILTKDTYIHTFDDKESIPTLIGRVLCNFCAAKTSFCHFAE